MEPTITLAATAQATLMPLQYAIKIYNGVLKRNDQQSQPLEPHELLTFAVAQILGQSLPYSEAEALALLTELQPHLQAIASDCEQCYANESVELPHDMLYIGESRWAMWGERTTYFDPKTLRNEDIPQAPVLAHLIHLGGAYTRLRSQIDQARGQDAESPTNTAEPTFQS